MSQYSEDKITLKQAAAMIEIAIREAAAHGVAGSGAGRRIGITTVSSRPVATLQDAAPPDSRGMGSKGVPMGVSLSQRGRVNQPKQTL